MTTDPDLALVLPPDPNERGTRLTTVIVGRPQCPTCHSSDLNRLRTEPTGDESVSRLMRCRGCGQTFRLVLDDIFPR